MIFLLQGSQDHQIKMYWLSQEYNLKCMVKRTFSFAASSVWNLRSEEVSKIDSVGLFKKNSKQLFETVFKIEEV